VHKIKDIESVQNITRKMKRQKVDPRANASAKSNLVQSYPNTNAKLRQIRFCKTTINRK